MKSILSFLFLFLSFGVFSQELLSPLMTNPTLYKKTNKLRSGTSLDSTFIYTYGTLGITDVWDDFSINKFVEYPPAFGAPNVTSQVYYYLLDVTNTIPEPSLAKYCDSAYAHHDTIVVVSGVEDTVLSSIFTPHDIWVNDLNVYPISGQVVDMYDECYVLVDSLIDGVPDPTQDTIWYTSIPTYTQDSIRLFMANMNDPSKIWIDHKVCRNYRYAIDPWSLGVATFDGVDSAGMPYDFGNLNSHGDADYLTSKSINLNGTSNVFLQFLYQAKGHGNMPEDEDSLMVDFWSPTTGVWVRQAFTPTYPLVADQWDTCKIAVPVFLLVNDFKFRIHNKATLSGALDHWHIDYVEMYEDNPVVPHEYKDLAISYPLTSLIEDYTSVPWDHYLNLSNPTEVMIDTAFLQVNNSDNTATNVGTGMFLEISQNGSADIYTLPNPGGISPWTSNWELGVNQFPFFVESNHTFDDPANDSMAIFDVKINIEAAVAGSNLHAVNDTTYMQQSFKNYYAYDDGSAEAGYGILGSNSQLAYEFNAYEADTLTGVLMHFVPTVHDVSSYIMLLTIWDDNNGVPGNVLYQDDYFTPHYPQYGWSKNEFKYYEFLNQDYPSAIPVPKKFYVGWEQIESQSFNVGMDRNIDNGLKIKFNVSGTWLTSSQSGSLMIRPVFSTAINYTLGDR
ncbi:MAG: hypothetical protein MK066_14325, partial [Crocinitomicaceae bacterium]|nr:hypothetical protein [Crocinitomicaceae bacterium]